MPLFRNRLLQAKIQNRVDYICTWKCCYVEIKYHNSGTYRFSIDSERAWSKSNCKPKQIEMKRCHDYSFVVFRGDKITIE